MYMIMLSHVTQPRHVDAVEANELGMVVGEDDNMLAKGVVRI